MTNPQFGLIDRAVAFDRDGLGEYRFGHAVASRADVDDPLARAEAPSATVTARDRAWSIYTGCYGDIDGHVREIVWNPAIELDSPSRDSATSGVSR